MQNKYKFDKITKFKESSSNIDICEINSFSINNGGIQKHFSGIYFASRYRHQYTGLLHDYIGGYLQLKKIYPDLKLIFFKYNESENNKKSVRNELPVLDFVKYFNADVINIDENSYLFDKIIFHNAEVPVFPDLNKLTDFNILDEFSNEIKIWRINSLKTVFEEFNSLIINNKIKNNIYITRSLINKFWMQSTNDYILNKRVQNEIYDEKLDNVLSSDGYQIVEFFNYSFWDQINISYNSNIYLTIDGSTLTNAIWCNPDAKIIKIVVNKEYTNLNYYWEDILNAVNKSIFKIIDVSDLSPEDGIIKIQKELSKI